MSEGCAMRDLDLGRHICCDLPSAIRREWLVANGIGGYACGTIAGSLTRRYHGLLVAALQPPLGRTLLLSKLDEQVTYDGQLYPLSVNHWTSGHADLSGLRNIERFRLEGTIPVWTFAFGDALLEKRVWMQRDANTTYVRYDLVRASQPLQMGLKALVNYRDYHGNTRAGGWEMEVSRVGGGLQLRAFEGATPLYLLSAGERGEVARAQQEWYRNFFLPTEAYRGLDSTEDILCAGHFAVELQVGESFSLVASTEDDPGLDGEEALESQRSYDHRMAATSGFAATPVAPLALSADQFIARRPLVDGTSGYTILAGYPWFGDWGRDTMISLPGLTLVTGRTEIAATILRTYASFVDGGMLPNRFPDSGEDPDYNTVDATLWLFEAVRAYHELTGDDELVRELFPALEEIIDWHLRGTRYAIVVDPADGLLRAGEPGTQLTWMDAKVGDWAVTPRIGKPVEINALWYNALCVTADFARQLGKASAEYEQLAAGSRRGFERFWNSDTGCCFDVLDGPDGDDGALRPNQLLAASLHHSPLSAAQQKGVVDTCSRTLLTSHGLRSLSPDHADYGGSYGGDQFCRDGVYHRGTVWGWMIGPFVSAHWRVYGDVDQVEQILQPMLRQLEDGCIGNLAEIFDGDPPFTPRGCFAQAWSVAEVLRVWRQTHP